MNKFFIFLFCWTAIQSGAEVKVEKIQLKNNLEAYRVSNKFFKTVLVSPQKTKSQEYSMNIIRGGWFKNIILKNSVDLLCEGITPDGTVRYGLAQIFEPLVEIPKDQKELIIPGIGIGTVDSKAVLKIKEFFPWHSVVSKTGENQENVKVSFLQDCDNSKKELNYKMRIDCIFSNTSLVELKGVFFNLSDKTIKARVSPMAIFNNSNSALKPWIVVPYQQARVVGGKRINYIDCEPIVIEKFRDYYEFSNERLSKAKRWIAVGGLEDDGVFAFISKAVLEKVVFWKTESCFSIFPYINIEAKPKERVEWTWQLVVGRGMKTVNNVDEKGFLGLALKKDEKDRYRCEMQFLPVYASEGVVMDVLLKSSRGSILQTKSYETFNISPLKPEFITMKLPKRIKAKERYMLKIEVFKKENLDLTLDQWIFPE
ncbi:MAG: hypothetical protein WC082_00400 [Victivallales bacterium]|jgi:CTP:phosphocholine cytidylyltransferase-like protein